MTRGKNLKRAPQRPGQQGFALVVAILALMLLTFLGLTLAATTSTELQIAANHRWSEQAYYNAEAGIELGRRVLMNANWPQLVWTSRSSTAPSFLAGPPPVPPGARPDHWNNAPRNFENGACDTDGGGAGYGWVLDDGTAQGPYQNVVQWRDANNNPHDLNGSFTLWVRPLVNQDKNGGLQEDTDTLVLTAEGTAPYVDDPTNLGDPVSGRFVRAHRAVQVLEVILSRVSTPRCNKDESQSGGDAAGSGMKACDPIPDALKGYGGGGTGNEINKTTR